MPTSKPSKIKLLDCTFRDGGYYNNWDFHPDLVAEYLKAIGSSKIDAVEMGFRSLPQSKFMGAFAYCTDDFLASLPLPKGVLIGVMVNAADLLKHKGGARKAVDLLFRKASRSPVGLVRIAIHFRDLAAGRPAVARLKQLGYTVCVNLMQSAGKSRETLADAARLVRSWKAADVLYFADSFGNMGTDMVSSVFSALREGWDGPIGIHAHNNMSQGIANSMAALDAGVAWMDGTILGMGRGAGNAQTEYLIVELNRRGVRRFDADSIFTLALGCFEELRRRHNWGPNLLYYLSATHGIHPTYVQAMLGKGQYTSHHVIAAIESLRKADASAYSTSQLEAALSSSDGSGRGTWSAKGWCRGRSALLVAAGPSLRSHADALCGFIGRKKPFVLCLNLNTELPEKKINAYAACHRVSLLLDADRYRFLKKPLAAPLGQVPPPIKAKLNRTKVLDYGMSVKKDTFKVSATSCVLPVPLVAAYAMALAEAGGAREILLAGFDGYGAADPRQHEMNHLLRCYLSRPRALPVHAVTPTTYEVAQGSIYAPLL